MTNVTPEQIIAGLKLAINVIGEYGMNESVECGYVIRGVEDAITLIEAQRWVPIEEIPDHFYSHTDNRENNIVDLILYSESEGLYFDGRVFEDGKIWTNSIMADTDTTTHAMLPIVPPMTEGE